MVDMTKEDVERLTIRPRPDLELEALGDCVIFRALEAPRTQGGLFVPQKGEGAEARKRAIVVSVGPGKLLEDGVTRRPMSIKPGDWIVVWNNAPPVAGVDHTGEVLWMVREDDIACRVVPAASSGPEEGSS